MTQAVSRRINPFTLLDGALAEGWQSIDSIPLRGQGTFLVLTISGLERLARNGKDHHRARRADGYGPQRTTVSGVDTGNYLGAIAWKWPSAGGEAMPTSRKADGDDSTAPRKIHSSLPG